MANPKTTDLFEKITFPSDSARLKRTGGLPPETLSPFVPVKNEEKSLAYKMAVDAGVKFDYPGNYKENARQDTATLRRLVLASYQQLQEGGWFEHQPDFSPEQAVTNLEQSIRQAIAGLKSRTADKHL